MDAAELEYDNCIGKPHKQRINLCLSENTKQLILEAKICHSEQALLMRRAVYRSKCGKYRTYVEECTEIIQQASDRHNGKKSLNNAQVVR